MSFIVRQISRTAEGRDIVRSRRLEQPALSVGRSPDCDIHLPDLAATLRHATIRAISPSRIVVEAAEGMPFEVDGRQITQSAEIDPARGATIRIGSHALAVSRGDGEDAGAAVITVERVGSISDVSDVKDEAKVFSLGGSAPGKRTMAWALALVVIAAFLIWPVTSFFTGRAADRAAAAQGQVRPIAFHSDETWSSGKLSLAHAALQNNCQACHQKPFVAVRDDACVACHTTIHDHADPERLAAAMAAPGVGKGVQLAVAGAFNRPQGRCVDCHTEHEGATAMPTTAQKFCSDCHLGLNERLTDTKILNASDFGSDHPQFRPAVMTSPSPRPIVQRVSLDARPIEDSGLKFPHALHLSKTNGVARMAQTMKVEYGFGDAMDCADCHVSDPSGARFVAVTMEKNCQMCHSLAFDQIGGTIRTLRHGDPKQVIADLQAYYRSSGPLRPINFGGVARHRPGDFAARQAAAQFNFAAANGQARADAAVRGVFSEGGACFDCHQVVQPAQSASGTFGIVPVRLTDRYMQKGWFDHASHQTETCQSCHAAETSSSASDVLLPKIASCQVCHGGESSHKQVPSSCAMCHDYHMTGGTPLMARETRKRGRKAPPPKSAESVPARAGA